MGKGSDAELAHWTILELKSNKNSLDEHVHYIYKMPYPHRVVTIPTGFKDLLEGVSKAVVKYQPESIPAFAAVFFNALLIFRDEKPSMPIHELMKEFRAAKGSHFYRNKNKAVKPQVEPQVTVQGPETFPRHKPLLEWEAGPLLMEARCEDVREPFSFISSDQPCSSRYIQATDAVAGASTDSDQNECDLQVSATTITLSPGPIPADIAQGLALYRRKIDLELSPRDSPPLGASANNYCARVRSALFERVSFSEISQELDAVLIQTSMLPLESLIIVQTEQVPEMIVFQAHPLLAESAAAAPSQCYVPVRSKCSCASMVGALKDVMAPLEVPSYPIFASICDIEAPVVERPDAMVSEPEESPALGDKVVPLEVHSAPVKPLEMTPSRPSIPVTTPELPGSAPAVSESPALAVQEVQISVTNRPLSAILHSFSGGTPPSETAEDVMLVPMVVSPPEPVKKAAREYSDLLCPLPAATLETESVSLICPPPSAVTVEIQPSILASPLTAATVETQSSNRICPSSVVTIETELANILSPPAAETEEAESSVVTCPHTAVTDDIVAPVSVCLPVVSLEETSVPSVQLSAPTPALTEETQSQSASPCLPTLPATGESRTPFLVYLPLPAPELSKTPGLLCQLGLGPEEAKNFPFLCLPISDIPRTPSLVAASPAPAQTVASDLPRTNLPGVTDIPRTLSYVAAGAQELPQLQSYAAYTSEVQGGPGMRHCTHSPGQCPASLQQQAGMAPLNHGQQTNTNFMPLCSQGPSPCSSLSRNGSHWRLCHLTRPESQGKMGGMICPYQNSLTMMHCNSLDHMANIPMYQDCGHYSSSYHLLPPCSQSSHGGLHTHHMAETRCPAHNLGTSFVQPQPQTCSSDPLFHFPQQNHLVATPSQERQQAQAQALCHLQCPLLQQRHSSLLLCGHQEELSRLGSSSCVPATNRRLNQGGVEQKDNIPSCASLHNKRIDTSSNNNQGCIMNCNPQGN
ncbi:hypothetical protein J4Q44_G00270720 [Coregonus suidteri]|uniref:Uncharacterized protein n=1 Tax=Coregonus suidteri TaxID=861788 RepID=A0AAN8L131_9TELE